MCGIFGYQIQPGALSPGRQIVLASTLARYNDRRGGHSWGLARVEAGAPTIERGLGEIIDRVDLLVGAQSFFAHTRWATHGEKTVENAHPFEIGALVGAHNGIIYNHGELNTRYERTFAVDSMHLFAHIDEGRALDELQGYGAIEWVDRRAPNVVRLARLREGELAIAGLGEHPNPQGVVWSSNKKHLQNALEQAGVEDYFFYKVPTGRLLTVQEGRLFDMGEDLRLSKPPRGLDWRFVGQSFGTARDPFSEDDEAACWACAESWDVCGSCSLCRACAKAEGVVCECTDVSSGASVDDSLLDWARFRDEDGNSSFKLISK